MLRVYFGHHKCASTWIWRIIAQICRDAGLHHRLVVDPETPSGMGPLNDYRNTFQRHELGDYLRHNKVDFASCITADLAQVHALDTFRGFHVVRDPRDIIVSAYFSHRNSHPVDDLSHMAAHRERLKQVSKDEGLLLEMEFSRHELLELGAWDYERPDILEIKMEDLTAYPYQTFLHIFQFLDLMEWDGQTRMKDKTRVFVRTMLNRLGKRSPLLAPLRRPMKVTGDMLLGRVYDNRFEKKTGGRKAGKQDVQSHYRKGKAGDWANHFLPAHVDFFKAEFGDLLIKLGYEADHEWEVVAPHVALAN